MLGSLMVGNCPELCSDPAAFEAYLRQYPQGSYAALAENWLKKLSAALAAHFGNRVTQPVAVGELPCYSATRFFFNSRIRSFRYVKVSFSRYG
jgi:hypothetical protein